MRARSSPSAAVASFTLRSPGSASTQPAKLSIRIRVTTAGARALCRMAVSVQGAGAGGWCMDPFLDLRHPLLSDEAMSFVVRGSSTPSGMSASLHAIEEGASLDEIQRVQTFGEGLVNAPEHVGPIGSSLRDQP